MAKSLMHWLKNPITPLKKDVKLLKITEVDGFYRSNPFILSGYRQAKFLYWIVNHWFSIFPLFNGILFPNLFRPIVRKNCSSDQDYLLKFETEVQEFANILISQKQFIYTVKGQQHF